MHGVRARTPVYFQSLKESLASICYILDRTSLLWTFRGVYNDRKVVFDNKEKYEEKMHGVRARTPVYFKSLKESLALLYFG